jgi:hypothetical protein
MDIMAENCISVFFSIPYTADAHRKFLGQFVWRLISYMEMERENIRAALPMA